MSGRTIIFIIRLLPNLPNFFRIFVDQTELSSPPFDSVSQVRFSITNPDHLLVSAWDAVRPSSIVMFLLSTEPYSWQTVRFYDVAANQQKAKFDHRAAVLATCFSDARRAYSGCLDASIREYVAIWFLFRSVSLMSCQTEFWDEDTTCWPT